MVRYVNYKKRRFMNMNNIYDIWFARIEIANSIKTKLIKKFSTKEIFDFKEKRSFRFKFKENFY